ncbi:MAG TPA: COQ9 family protein [Rickettsiales bacterium]|nr:COQ9 family protein [Rickettsiales bacterium]
MDDKKQAILKHALKLVPFDGWSEYTLSEAARQAGVPEQELKKLFPAGVRDCVTFLLETQNDELAQAMQHEKLETLRVPDRIEKIILARLEKWQSMREVIRRTVSFNALPWNSMAACKGLYDVVDLIWRLAGDKSTDFNFYTKRMTLSAVYSSTVLFWLNDDSEQHEETVQFLKRRLNDVAAFGRFTNKFKRA